MFCPQELTIRLRSTITQLVSTPGVVKNNATGFRSKHSHSASVTGVVGAGGFSDEVAGAEL